MPHAVLVEKMVVKLVSTQIGTPTQAGQLQTMVLKASSIQQFDTGFGKAVDIANDQQMLHFDDAALRYDG